MFYDEKKEGSGSRSVLVTHGSGCGSRRSKIMLWLTVRKFFTLCDCGFKNSETLWQIDMLVNKLTSERKYISLFYLNFFIMFSSVWDAELAGDNGHFPQLYCQTETGSGVSCKAKVLYLLLNVYYFFFSHVWICIFLNILICTQRLSSLS
jgi:hypothetical protein